MRSSAWLAWTLADNQAARNFGPPAFFNFQAIRRVNRITATCIEG